MAARVYIAAFGSGLGHASRMTLVATGLLELGVQVTFSSSGEAYAFLKGSGFRCNRVPMVDVGWSAKGELAGVSDTVRRFPTMVWNFVRQVRAEVANLKRFKPHVVVSDSRLSAVFAAKLLGIPRLTIVNQLRILLPAHAGGPLTGLFEDIGAEVLGALWSPSDAILLPDLPPPFTIAEKNLWRVKGAMRKATYVGFITPPLQTDSERIREVADRLGIDGGRPLVFAQISGPAVTKKRVVSMLLAASKRCGGRMTLVVSEGIPGASTEPVRVNGAWYYRWCPVRDELFTLADALVSRGGHTSIAQAVVHGKPMVVMPIPRHSEQAGNAWKVEKLGLGVAVDQNAITPDGLCQTIRRVLENEEHSKTAYKLKNVAAGFGGLKNVLEAVRKRLPNSSGQTTV